MRWRCASAPSGFTAIRRAHAVRASAVAAEPLGLLLISGGHERAHYAFLLAAGAAALGRPVTLFATNAGCRALCADLAGFAAADAAVQAVGVAGLPELRSAAVELGVRLIACEAGLRIARLAADALLPGVEIAGVATFLAAAAGGQIVSL
jgi:peroxiredoxin family protein